MGPVLIMSDGSDIKSLLAMGAKTLEKVESLEQDFRDQRKEDRADHEKMRAEIQDLRDTIVAQEAKVQVFWETGKGSQWEKDIEDLQARCKENNDLLQVLEKEKAKQRGMMLGIGAGGAGIVELFAKIFG